MPGYERLNKNVLRRARKMLRLGKEVMLDARSIHTEAPATGNARVVDRLVCYLNNYHFDRQ
jgi:hypothetical protein